MAFLHSKPAWSLSESAVTPESRYLNRRQILKGLGAGTLLATAGPLFGAGVAQAAASTDTSDLYPAARSSLYEGGRPLTREEDAITYNNFYEFGSNKSIHQRAQQLKLDPWMIEISGMVNRPHSVDFYALIRKMRLEQRIYRHRCVEAWAMTVPWDGFSMRQLIKYADPLSSAKYVEFQTLTDQATMPGLKQSWYPWPYTEALTLGEANHDLTFMATGIYGKAMPKQNGAPLRMVAPWKYGFKSIKSIVRINFTDKRPISFWEAIQPDEYGFWANVNPQVPHRRWSQATERLLTTGERVPTQLYNGYAPWVAGLYSEVQKTEKIFF
ncbi:MAG: protein-methionine-sulfoxide reductase catalytic subunit MsrP [Alphaproteobacteria bacterium]|nr:protein-methionine-sulfoxide reductase catalytic subunit MsrP [Alphaproteobacteria bacterium]